jgi:hypothetical protein
MVPDDFDNPHMIMSDEFFDHIINNRNDSISSALMSFKLSWIVRSRGQAGGYRLVFVMAICCCQRFVTVRFIIAPPI